MTGLNFTTNLSDYFDIPSRLEALLLHELPSHPDNDGGSQHPVRTKGITPEYLSAGHRARNPQVICKLSHHNLIGILYI